MKKRIAVLLAGLMLVSMAAACAPKTPTTPAATEAPKEAAATEAPTEAAATEAPTEAAPATEAPAAPAGDTYIAVISKGFQHQFWQTVAAGSQAAADKYGVKITFDGPPSESDIPIQIEQLNAALAKNPAALCLAALDTDSVTQQLNDAKAKGIPVVGFDSGVPNAPEGTIVSTASTNNEAAGAVGAEEMFKIAELKAKIDAATPDAPIVIGCMSQDATSASIVGRTTGFLNKMFELCDAAKPGEVAITGHDKYNKPSGSGKVAIELNILVPATTNITDCQTTAQAMFAKKGIAAVFCSNEATVAGTLAATTDGQDLDRANGKFKDIVVVGFDAGANQKNAVKNGWFNGSITQDPYQIGFLAVELAYKAINKEAVEEVVDTGCKFYTAANMEEADIAPLLYD